MATSPKTTRVKCLAETGCSIVRTWSDQKKLLLDHNDTVDVPPDVAVWLDSLSNFTATTKRAKKPKPEHQDPPPPPPPDNEDEE